MTDPDQAPDPTERGAQIAAVPRISIQAFCETADMAALVSDVGTERRMARAHMKVHMGGAAAAAEAYRAAPTPNLIIIESSAERAMLLGSLESLAESCDAGTKVIIVGHLNDIVLYRDLMARGVSDYLVMPVGVLDLVRAISQLYTHPSAAPLGRVVAVTGCKGGCGASTVAHNMAWSISRELDVATVIVDLDLAFGTAGLNFNQDPPQSIADAVFAPDRLDANLVDRLLSKCTDRLSLLAAPATLDQPYDLPETAFDGVLDILRGSVPCIVLDVPHQWTAWSRRALAAADEVVLVAAPDLANLRNAKNLVDLLRTARVHDTAPRLVMNGIGLMKRPEIAVADFAKAVELSPMATIPFDAKLFGTAANNGQMIGEVEAGGKVAGLFNDLAHRVSGRVEARRAKRSLLSPLVARLGRKRLAT
ncbi:AAA family ATPase [Lichenihabitans sp. Uapishka_5]|uniref:AAA family ATPase n=1 Tax=Lichenihabitans sp. Uapishka_5 TaxID=3037302 RepID=UPI0029E7F2B2|nr:AAA family ATPase [Lichenihabitans sp. Uapishka_5]MDX7952767.1 AAA family ATPase [Lichenihabitans sp. Uapishka_5]